MSTRPAVTMQDLELEHAELLPSRETLWVCHPQCGSGSSTSYSFTQVGYGNTAQSGLVNVSVANGSLDNILSLGSGNIL
ncbi:MAG: hypothetical protein ACLPKI_17880 [Streptosporangiaceae bacterium]